MSASTETYWLPGTLGPVQTVLHRPVVATGSAVVMVPPWGWERACSFRNRRAWALQLARSGHPVLRLDLPGTGESPAPRDANLLPAWLAAIAASVPALRQLSGVSHVTVLGLGLGGLLAAAAGVGDDLVIWASPASGRAAVRELRAFAAVADPAEPRASGDLWVSGYRMPEATVTALAALSVEGGLAGFRRALVLGRDGAGPPSVLVSVLSSRCAVTTAQGHGWTALHVAPEAPLPSPVLDAVANFLAPAGTVVDPRLSHPRLMGVPQLVDLPLVIGSARASVTRAAHGRATLTAVLPNAGGLGRTGPSDLWLDVAQRYAELGISTVRVDLPGIGDSDGPETWIGGDAAFYDERLTRDLVAVLDQLPAHGLPPRFLLAGLCSGAYWSLQVASADSRVVGAVLLNPRALTWHPRLLAVRRTAELRKLRSVRTWRKVLLGRISWSYAAGTARAALVRAWQSLGERCCRAGVSSTALASRQTAALLDRTRDAGVMVHLAFSQGEPLEAELRSDGLTSDPIRWPHLSVHQLGGPPQAHTLGTPDLRQAALDVLLDVARELV